MSSQFELLMSHVGVNEPHEGRMTFRCCVKRLKETTHLWQRKLPEVLLDGNKVYFDFSKNSRFKTYKRYNSIFPNLIVGTNRTEENLYPGHCYRLLYECFSLPCSFDSPPTLHELLSDFLPKFHYMGFKNNCLIPDFEIDLEFELLHFKNASSINSSKTVDDLLDLLFTEYMKLPRMIVKGNYNFEFFNNYTEYKNSDLLSLYALYPDYWNNKTRTFTDKPERILQRPSIPSKDRIFYYQKTQKYLKNYDKMMYVNFIEMLMDQNNLTFDSMAEWTYRPTMKKKSIIEKQNEVIRKSKNLEKEFEDNIPFRDLNIAMKGNNDAESVEKCEMKEKMQEEKIRGSKGKSVAFYKKESESDEDDVLNSLYYLAESTKVKEVVNLSSDDEEERKDDDELYLLYDPKKQIKELYLEKQREKQQSFLLNRVQQQKTDSEFFIWKDGEFERIVKKADEEKMDEGKMEVEEREIQDKEEEERTIEKNNNKEGDKEKDENEKDSHKKKKKKSNKKKKKKKNESCNDDVNKDINKRNDDEDNDTEIRKKNNETEEKNNSKSNNNRKGETKNEEKEEMKKKEGEEKLKENETDFEIEDERSIEESNKISKYDEEDEVEEYQDGKISTDDEWKKEKLRMYEEAYESDGFLEKYMKQMLVDESDLEDYQKKIEDSDVVAKVKNKIVPVRKGIRRGFFNYPKPKEIDSSSNLNNIQNEDLNDFYEMNNTSIIQHVDIFKNTGLGKSKDKIKQAIEKNQLNKPNRIFADDAAFLAWSREIEMDPKDYDESIPEYSSGSSEAFNNFNKNQRRNQIIKKNSTESEKENSNSEDGRIQSQRCTESSTSSKSANRWSKSSSTLQSSKATDYEIFKKARKQKADYSEFARAQRKKKTIIINYNDVKSSIEISENLFNIVKLRESNYTNFVDFNNSCYAKSLYQCLVPLKINCPDIFKDGEQHELLMYWNRLNEETPHLEFCVLHITFQQCQRCKRSKRNEFLEWSHDFMHEQIEDLNTHCEYCDGLLNSEGRMKFRNQAAKQNPHLRFHYFIYSEFVLFFDTREHMKLLHGHNTNYPVSNRGITIGGIDYQTNDLGESGHYSFGIGNFATVSKIDGKLPSRFYECFQNKRSFKSMAEEIGFPLPMEPEDVGLTIGSMNKYVHQHTSIELNLKRNNQYDI